MRNLRRQDVYSLLHDPESVNSALAAYDYRYRLRLETQRYIRFVFSTWWGLVCSIVFGGLGLVDLFGMFVYALGGTVVLFVILGFCLIFNSPLLAQRYELWLTKYVPYFQFQGNVDSSGIYRTTGWIGVINSANRKLFDALTITQANVGKEYLGEGWDTKSNTPRRRHFNLDAAKLL